MQFYFIRHGQSANNQLWHQSGSYSGRTDDPQLTETGQRQAKALAQYLLGPRVNFIAKGQDNQNVLGFSITHLYSSLMVRAVATGTIIAQTLDLPLIAWLDLHEGGGIWLEDEETGERVGRAGRNRAYFETHYPDLVLPDALQKKGWWNRPFEEYEQRPVRAQRVLCELLERHGQSEDRVAVISHGGFYNTFITALLALPQSDGYWFSLNNTGVTRIDFQAESVGLVYMNRVDFLPRELVTGIPRTARCANMGKTKRRFLLALFLTCLVLAVSGCGSEQSPTSTPESPQADDQTTSLELSSAAFAPGGSIPPRFTCDGDDISPPLQWSDPPEGTQSFALVVDDPDASSGTWVHWVLYNLPAAARMLPEAVPTNGDLDGGGRHGKNSWKRLGYGGPCPPSGTHRYFFKLYALSTALDLDAGEGKEGLLGAMQGHILAQGELMGTYSRQ